MAKGNSTTRLKRSFVSGLILSVIFLGSLNGGCSMSSTILSSLETASVSILEYAIESLLGTTSDSTTSS